MRKAATVTVTGWVGGTPREVVGGAVPFTSFRVSVQERRWDSRLKDVVDGPLEWFTVKAFRELATNVAESIRKGDPVVVTGRLRTETWEGEKGQHAGFVIEADAVGHDLAWGATSFRRRVNRTSEGTQRVVAVDDDMPEDPWAGEAEPVETVDAAGPHAAELAGTP